MPSSADLEQLISWFLTHKSPVIHDSMLCSVQEECGLGSPPSHFTTNACKTANSMLKNEVHHKRSDMSTFLDKVSNLVHKQEHEVERAIIGRRKYELRPQYKSFHIPEIKWFAMSTSQREQHLRRFADASVLDFTFPNDSAMDADLPPQHYGRDTTAASSLSVDVSTVASVACTPLTCLEGIWSKASDRQGMQ